MRRIMIALAAFMTLAISGCSTVDREAIAQVEATHGKVLPKYLEYVEKDETLTAEQKDDRRKLVESLKRLVAALKKSAGGD